MVIKRNHAKINFDASSINEGFARMVVMGFMMDMNPTMDELEDVKTAVSEAVTNAIIHGYGDVSKENKDRVTEHQVEMICVREGNKLSITVTDFGAGIENIEEARQPFFTTKPEQERSGMGFAFMETFMDEVDVISKIGEGTRVTMCKYINGENMSLKEKCDW